MGVNSGKAVPISHNLVNLEIITSFSFFDGAAYSIDVLLFTATIHLPHSMLQFFAAKPSTFQ